MRSICVILGKRSSRTLSVSICTYRLRASSASSIAFSWSGPVSRSRTRPPAGDNAPTFVGSVSNPRDPRRSRRALVAVAAEHFLDRLRRSFDRRFHLLLDAVDRALRLRAGARLVHLFDHPARQLGEAYAAGLLEVEAIHRFGEAQVRVDAGDDDAGIDGHELDA